MAWLPPARVAAAIATGAVVLAVVVAVGPRFPLATVRGPVDLRQSLSRPLNLSQVPNPLAQLPAIQATGSAPAFNASVDQMWLANPASWQLSTLDTYDGINWGSDANATKVGNVLPVTVSPPGPITRVRVRAAGQSSPWVPTVGVIRMVSPANLNYDPNAGVLVDTRQHPGSSYTITATLPTPSLSDLDGAGVPDTAAVTGLVAVPACFPAALRTEAQQAVTNLFRPVQEAVAIEQELSTRGGYRINNQVLAPDTSCAGLTQLATKKVGTTEQYATAFALMARSVGLPARLAVGFTPGVIHGHQVTVPGSDATVWPEVEFANVGWVPFTPSPTTTSSGGGPTTVPPTTTQAGTKPGAQTGQSESGLNRVRQTVAGGATTTLPAATTVPGPPHHHPSGSARWWWVTIPTAIVASVGAVVLGRLATRRRRRTRRRCASIPETRVVGAWQEILDQLNLLGRRTSGLTPSEVVGEAAGLAPQSATPVARVARAVDVAVYAGEPDESLQLLADEAWSASDAARRALTDVVPLGLRMRLALVGSGSQPTGSRAGRIRSGRGRRRA